MNLPSSRAKQGKTNTAMVFDYSKDWAGRAQALINREGLTVLDWFRNGTEWITSWQKGKPYVVVMDLLLPKRDGLYCLQKMIELNPDSRVLFTHSLQGMAANEIEIKALSIGALAVLQKPYTDARFLLGLRRAINAQRVKRTLNIVQSHSSGDGAP